MRIFQEVQLPPQAATKPQEIEMAFFGVGEFLSLLPMMLGKKTTYSDSGSKRRSFICRPMAFFMAEVGFPETFTTFKSSP